MVERKPTALGMELGAELRRRREAKGLNGREMAHKLVWDPSKVSRLENGIRDATELDVAIYLATCDVPRPEIDKLLDLMNEDESGYRFRSHGEKLPDELRTLVFHETHAHILQNYEVAFIPGLLQTENFARALLQENSAHDENARELRVEARMGRQSMLSRPELDHCVFYIHERILNTQVGSAEIMHEQILHLVFATARPRCEIRIVLDSSGGRGLANGAFKLMTFKQVEPVVYAEHEAFSMFLTDRQYAKHSREVLQRLDGVALNEGQSREWLAALATRYERAKYGSDVRRERGLGKLKQEQLQQ